MGLKDYIPGEMSVVVGTAIVNDWESLDVEYDDDFWKFSQGSGGEITRTKNSSRLGTITVELPQTQEANLILSTAAEGNDTINCSIVDINGNSVHVITKATVLRKPNSPYSKDESSTREWKLKGSLDINVIGGN